MGNLCFTSYLVLLGLTLRLVTPNKCRHKKKMTETQKKLEKMNMSSEQTV